MSASTEDTGIKVVKKWIRSDGIQQLHHDLLFYSSRLATICYLQFNNGPLWYRKKEVSIHWFLCQEQLGCTSKRGAYHFPWFRGCWCQKISSGEKERRKGLDLWKTIFITPISQKKKNVLVAHFKQKINELVPTVQVNVILLQILYRRYVREHLATRIWVNTIVVLI